MKSQILLCVALSLTLGACTLKAKTVILGGQTSPASTTGGSPSGGGSGSSCTSSNLPAYVSSPANADLACVVAAGGCDVVIGTGSGNLNFDQRSDSTQQYAGKKVCIKNGNYGNFFGIGVYGKPGQPVTFINCGGQVVFTSGGSSPFDLEMSRYIHITGTGSAANQYGIVAAATTYNVHIMTIQYGSSDIEIDHIEAKGNTVDPTSGSPAFTSGQGISIHTYPNCTAGYWGAVGDWRRGTFTQYNTSVHDTYVHDTGLEGMYIGSSHYGWVNANSYNPGFTCPSSVTYYEAELSGVQVYNNRVENTGYDGIQIGAASLGSNSVRNNIIKNYGLANNSINSGGMQVNPGTKAVYENNWIEVSSNVPQRYTQGISHQGLAGSIYRNNVIINASVGFIMLRETDTNMGNPLGDVPLYNNTVVNSSIAMQYWGGNFQTITAINNLFTGYTTGYSTGDGNTACISGSIGTQNLWISAMSGAGFVNAAGGDYHLLSTSAATNSATSLVGTVDYDYAGLDRRCSSYDFGAYAF